MLDGGREERPSSGRRGYYLFDGGGGGGGCIGDWWLGSGACWHWGVDAARGVEGESESDSCGCRGCRLGSL